jgi:hypothetical protein
MKWLLVFPDDGEMNAGIAEGLRGNGIAYDFVDARRFPHLFFEAMVKNKGKYDAVMMSRTESLYPGFVQSKYRFPKVKYMIWNPDTRDTIEMWGFVLNKFFREVDYYFFMDETTLPLMRMINPNTHYLPQGIHEERYHKVVVNAEDHAKYDCDVSFIGSIIPEIHRERHEVMQAFKDSKFDFRMFNGVWGDEHNKAVMCSRINLSCEHSPDKKGYFSVRNYKVIACGGICLDLFHEGLDKLFGDACHYFRNPIEALQKTAELLGNYAEFKAKAEKFRIEALEKHTYTERISRVKALLETGKWTEY